MLCQAREKTLTQEKRCLREALQVLKRHLQDSSCVIMDEGRESKGLSSLIAVARVAEMLTVSESLIYKMVNLGTIPHYRFGKTIRFDITELTEWLKTKSINPSSPTSTADSEHEMSLSSSNQEGSSRSNSSDNLMRDVDRILKSPIIEGK